MKLSMEKKIILFVLILFAFICSIIFFIILPTCNQIKKMKYETHQMRVRLEENFIKTKSLRVNKLKMEEIQEEALLLKNHLIYKGEELKFLTLVEGIIHKNNLIYKINNTSFDSATNHINLSFSAEGKYQNALNFIKNIESLPYFVRIDSLRLSCFSKNDNEGKIILNMSVSVYAN